MNLIPAYGRDYKSKAEVEKDFNDGKDFTIADVSSPYDGKYINKPQVIEAGVSIVTVRYGKLRKVTMIPVRSGNRK